MWTRSFWLASLERAVKTLAQAALAMLVGDGLGVTDIDWGDVASVAGLAAIASVLMSVVSAPFGPVGSPSLVEDEAAADTAGPVRD